MYTITVIYLDETNSVLAHKIKGEKFLIYKDLLDCPTKVRRIMNDGLVFDRVDKDENILRSGSIIPPGRIVRIYWDDDCLL